MNEVLIGLEKKGCSEKHPLDLPQEYAVDVYPKVRLEAGALHLANYLIRIRGLLLIAKIGLIPNSTSEKRKKPSLIHSY